MRTKICVLKGKIDTVFVILPLGRGVENHVKWARTHIFPFTQIRKLKIAIDGV